ncbi:LytR/AlgR family response regulator transcription factor [Paenibacillus sp. CAU 1782]
MLYGVICDDDAETHENLRHFFGDFENIIGRQIFLTHFFSGEELIEHYRNTNSHHFHFLFLDIELPGINGLETAKQLRSLPNRDIIILFLSSYPQYVMESFDALTFQYLLKPLSFDIFKSKMMRIYDHINSTMNKVLLLKDYQGKSIVSLSEIIAILKLKHSFAQNKLKVVTAEQEYIIKGTISSYQKKLGQPFLLVYRSVLVNMDYIRRFTVQSVVMSNSQEFPISRAQTKLIKDTYSHYMAGRFIV